MGSDGRRCLWLAYTLVPFLNIPLSPWALCGSEPFRLLQLMFFLAHLPEKFGEETKASMEAWG